MKDVNRVENHYTRGSLLDSIRAGVEALGKSPQTVTIHDLAPVDEFHIGGRVATRAFLDRLSVVAGEKVLDVGCGIGGASRFAAQEYQCAVTGIDLTGEFVRTGRELCKWVNQELAVNLIQGNVLETGIPDATFDKAFMLHVGMNIADKTALAREIFRVLKPGGIFGIYDVMKAGDVPLAYPVPWASAPPESALGSPKQYKEALRTAGFGILDEINRREFAIKFFENLKARSAAADGPSPLGLHLVMGEEVQPKINNMLLNIARGSIAPVELVARKP